MPVFRSKVLALPALLAALVVTSNCGSTDTTATSPEPASMTQVFTGTLSQSGSTFFSFTTNQQGTISFQLTKVQRNGANTGETLTIGLGGPRATDCSVTTSVTVAASSDTLLSASQTPGTYCVRVWDQAVIAGPVQFSVNINRPVNQ
jgi:hypothetical protein